MVKTSKGKEGYVRMKKRERCLLASVRLGVTNALGDKGKGRVGECADCVERRKTREHTGWRSVAFLRKEGQVW